MINIFKQKKNEKKKVKKIFLLNFYIGKKKK